MKYQSNNGKVLVVDDLQNVVTSMNCGTDRLNRTHFVPNDFLSWEEMGAMYMKWLGRRICDLIPSEALKKGWTIVCPSWEDAKIKALDRYTNEILSLPQQLSGALKSQRCFGGALIVAIVNDSLGSFLNPIPEHLPKGTLLGIQAFDAWQCQPGLINLQNPQKKNFRLPETYSIGSSGLMLKGKENIVVPAGTMVNWTRVQRFDGLYLPWYLKSRNLYWGQSLLASAYSAVRNAQLVDSSIATLLFRASVPVFKVHDLQDIVSDCESKSAFLERVNLMNYGMSNNNMAIIDSEEQLESFEPGAISNLDGILERFYVVVSTATGIPVTKLIGESARGLNATGEGDLNNYYDLVEDYQNTEIKPALIDMYRRWFVPSLFGETIPIDFKIDFPPIERVSPKEKQEQDSEFQGMLISAVDSGLIDKKVARRELLKRGVYKSYSEDDIKRIESNEGENEIEMADALKVADEIYNNKLQE